MIDASQQKGTEPGGDKLISPDRAKNIEFVKQSI
jgi:hypothetical protein